MLTSAEGDKVHIVDVGKTSKGAFMTMEFQEFEKLTSVDPALFEFTPPSDVPVVDMDKVFAERGDR